jgi:cob(I)alamin adenosyltransferase
MVRIYTGKGDDGTTSLWYGGRVSKTDARTEAYGTVDEANSALGVARAICKREGQQELHETILTLQRNLFVLGAELASAPEAAGRLEGGISRITDEMIERAEAEIDRYMNEVELPPHFVIPGGTELSAALDVARTVIRRAERRVVELRDSEQLEIDTVLRYLNRASDLAFALARFADEDEPELFEGRDAG